MKIPHNRYLVKKHLKIPKGNQRRTEETIDKSQRRTEETIDKSQRRTEETIDKSQRTEETIDKRKNNDLQNTTHKTKD